MLTLSVTVPDVPPPVNPVPAVTPSMSPASFVNEITPVELLYDISPVALINPLTCASVLYYLIHNNEVFLSLHKTHKQVDKYFFF